MSKFKQLLSDTFVYGISSVLTRFINLLLLPLYTRVLTPSEYGVLNILNTTFSITWLIALLALDSASFVFFHDKDDLKYRKSVFSSWFWLQTASSVFIATIILIFAGFFSEIFFSTKEYKTEFSLIALLLLANLLPNIVWNWFRSLRKVKATAVFTLVQSLIIIGLNIWLIVGLKWGVKGFFIAQLASGAIMSIASMLILKDWIRPVFFSKTLLNGMLKYSLPLVPTAIATWGLSSVGGYFIQAFRGTAEVGLYQTGVTMSGLLTFVIASFTQAWGPFALSIKNEQGAKEFYGKVFILYVSVIGFIAASVTVFSSELLSIAVAPSYSGSHWVMSLLCFNAMVIGLNYIASIGLNLAKDMRPFAKAIIIGSVINLFFYYFGAKYFGKEGCALASMLSNLGIVFFIFIYAQKKVFIPFDFGKGGVIGLFCIALAFCIKFLVPLSDYLSIVLKAVSILGLLMGLLYVNRIEVISGLKKIGVIK